MPRPPIRKTQQLAEAQAYGETLGRLKAEAHFKSLKSSDRLEQGLLDRLIEKIDPVEALAIASLTYLVKPMIEGLDIAVLKIKSVVPEGYYGLLPWILGLGTIESTDKVKYREIMESDQFKLWLLAFSVAFIIYRFGPQIVSSMGGIKEMVKGLVI